jgi:hypothetical protein
MLGRPGNSVARTPQQLALEQFPQRGNEQNRPTELEEPGHWLAG